MAEEEPGKAMVVAAAGVLTATKTALLLAGCTMAAAALLEAVETIGHSWPQILLGLAMNLNILVEEAVAAVVAELEGFPAALGGWEVSQVARG